jgi:hypothetical protein
MHGDPSETANVIQWKTDRRATKRGKRCPWVRPSPLLSNRWTQEEETPWNLDSAACQSDPCCWWLKLKGRRDVSVCLRPRLRVFEEIGEDPEKINKREAVIWRRGAVPLCLFRLREQRLAWRLSLITAASLSRRTTAARGVKTSHGVSNYCIVRLDFVFFKKS